MLGVAEVIAVPASRLLQLLVLTQPMEREDTANWGCGVHLSVFSGRNCQDMESGEVPQVVGGEPSRVWR